jgi:hypothetical protein
MEGYLCPRASSRELTVFIDNNEDSTSYLPIRSWGSALLEVCLKFRHFHGRCYDKSKLGLRCGVQDTTVQGNNENALNIFYRE